MREDRRGFTPWEHEEDEFDSQAEEDSRPRDWLDDQDEDDLEKWLGDR